MCPVSGERTAGPVHDGTVCRIHFMCPVSGECATGGGDVIGVPMHTEPIDTLYDVGAKYSDNAGGPNVTGTPMHTEPVGSIVGAKKVS